MDSDSVAFWGVPLKPDKPLELTLKEGESLNVTMASFGPKLQDNKGRSVVMVKSTGNDEELSVCSLRPVHNESIALDLHFEGEETLSFTLHGKNEVHLTGNFAFEEEDDEDGSAVDPEDLMETAAADMAELDESDDEESDDILNEKPVIKELKDDGEAESDDGEEGSSEEDAEMPPAKGPKGKKKVEADESDEEDAEADEEEASKPKKQAQPNGSAKKGGKKKAGKGGNKATPKKPEPKKEEKKAPAKPEPEQKKGNKSNKRKSVDPKVNTPAKKAKAEANGDVEMKTPEPKASPGNDAAQNKSAKKTRYRKRKSQAGSTPAAK